MGAKKKPKKLKPRIEVCTIDTDEVVSVIELNSTNERHVEKVMTGLLMKMDDSKYYAREIDT